MRSKVLGSWIVASANANYVLPRRILLRRIYY